MSIVARCTNATCSRNEDNWTFDECGYCIDPLVTRRRVTGSVRVPRTSARREIHHSTSCAFVAGGVAECLA